MLLSAYIRLGRRIRSLYEMGSLLYGQLGVGAAMDSLRYNPYNSYTTEVLP